MTRAFFLIAGFFGWLLMVTGPVWADSVPVRGADHGDYGRLEFNWPSPVSYEAAIDGNRLIVRFSRTIQTDLSQAIGALRKYASDAFVNPDGQSVTVVLNRTWGLDYFDMGRSVIVDLLDEGGTAPLAPSPSAPLPVENITSPEPASSVPEINVRFGDHPTFSRVVFDWSVAPHYLIEEGDGTATLIFDRNARIDLAGVRRDLPNNVRGIDAFSEAGGLTVILEVPKGAGVKHFLSGPKVVLDIQNAPQETQRIAENPAPKAEEPPAPKPAKVAAVEKAEPVPPQEQKTTPTPQPETANKPMRLVPQSEAKLAPLPSAKPPTSTGQGGLPPGVIPSPPRPVKPEQTAAPEQKPAEPPSQTQGMPPSMDQTAQMADEGGMSPSMTSAQAVPGDALFSLTFNWDEPVAAAVFRRGGSLWAVFDKQSKQDTNALMQTAKGSLTAVDQIDSDNATLVRMETKPGLNPSMRRDGLAWILDFKQQSLKTRKEITARAETIGEAGRRLFIPVQQAGKAVPLRDPSAGDNLVIVPVIPLGHGVGQKREYPEFVLLPTGQGVVMRPRVDNIRVRPFVQGIELTSDTGLKITPMSAKAEAAAKIGAPGIVKRIFDTDTWRLGDVRQFEENKQKLQYDIATSKAVKRRAARMELAKFYLAQKMGHEAVAVLDLVAQEDEAMLARPEFRALRGAAQFLKSRFKEALQDLSHPSLAGNHEAEFWKAATQASIGQIKVAAEEMRRTGSILRKYPRNLKFPLGALAAETAITVGDVEQAQHFIDMLALDDPSPQEEGQLAYLEGRIAELSGDFDKAVERWEAAQLSAHRPSRAKAAYARAELLRKTEEFEAQDAIEALEKLRFAWRGDNFEFTLLRKLGGLYFQIDDFRNGLQTLRQAATYFRTHPQAPMVTQEMARAFRHLYLEGGADKLSPVTAIALFDEFKELTPAGDTGDLMIRRLADRLIGVDLLERAAKLLENQVQFRLSGEERARVGAKLALIYMQNRKLEQALTALDQTAVAGVPEELNLLRRHLRARTLMELGRTEQVALILANDESMEADLIRSELYWRKRDWPKAAQSLRRVLQGAGAKPNEPLDNKQAKYVMNLAVALTLGANERGVHRLRGNYEKAMEASPYADAFRLITSSDGRGLIDYRTVSQRVREVESFQSFMSAYKERLKATEQPSSG